jgi:hypothetical protein
MCYLPNCHISCRAVRDADDHERVAELRRREKQFLNSKLHPYNYIVTSGAGCQATADFANGSRFLFHLCLRSTKARVVLALAETYLDKRGRVDSSSILFKPVNGLMQI